MTNIVSHLLGYESGNAKTKWPVLKEDCFAEPEIIKCNPDGHQTDPIAVTFSESLFDQRLLAMADYDGYVSMLNTSEVLPDCINVIDEPDQNVKAQWVAHHNAINDLRFIKGDRQLLTAATDFNLRQWDTMTAACVATLAGHSASVKCLSVHPFCSDVVASGGKDGSIMLWDLRVPACATEQFHVRGAQVHVEVAHRPRSPGSGIFSQAGSDVSITSLQFLKHSGLLASASDTSSTVKLWDVRMIENPVAFLSAELPAGETLPPHLNVAPLSNHLDFKSSSGLCHLSTDPDVMRRDGRIHMYDAPRADCSIQPSKEFRVSEPLTLRSTTAVSPDGQWLAATSAYGSTFVFNVNDTRGEPSRLHAGQSGQWQRRYHDASGNMGPIRTAARPDAEATGVCWGKLGSGELAICRTAQQLQVWRSDYVNHDLGMKPPTASKRQEWPTFFEDATESTACNAADNVGIAISECAEQAARAAEHSAVSRLADTCMDRRRSAAHVHAVSGTSSVTVPVTTAGHSDQSSLPAAATAARSEADRPIKGPVHEKAGFSGTAAVAEPGGSASALPVSTAGSTTPQNLHSGASKQSGAALSAALLLPAPAARNPPQSAERHPATRHSIAADATTPTRISNRAQDAGDCPASEGAATPALCHEDVNEARPSRQESDAEACNGPETEATESVPPSRQNSEEYLPRMSYSAQPSQHGLNNTFVEIALSPQRLSRPARSLGQGLSPSMRAASFQAANSDPAQSGSEVRAGLRTSSGQPSQHAPLATLSSADLIRSPSALMRSGRGAQPPWRPTGVLSPINELPLSVVEGDDIVPETQSIDDSPLRPTVAPIATQFSQARQRDVPKLGSTIPPSAHAVPAATLSQQIALAHTTCEDSLLAAGQHASCSAQRQHPSEEPEAVPHQHQGKAQASAGQNATTERKAAPQLCSSREIGQEPELKQRHARKRASVEMTADVLVRDMGQSGASGCEKRSGTKHSRQPSLAPDEANGASHPKFQPPVCDSQPREVFAIVKCKRRRITATSVHTNARSKSAFKAAGCSAPAKATQEDSMSMKSQGCSGENSAGMLNITSQQDCTQDSSSLVPNRKMVVGESLKQLGLRRRRKASAKSQPAGSQPNIMSFFRRD